MITQSINIVFTSPSTVAFTRPVQQVTLLESSNPYFLRQAILSQDGLKIVRGQYSIQIPMAQLFNAAVSASPSMSWAPRITTQPVAVSASTQTAPAWFHVTASTETSTSFQWQFLSASAANYTNITGSKQFTSSVSVQGALVSSSLYVTSSYAYGGYTFRAILTNLSGYTTSSAVVLTALNP